MSTPAAPTDLGEITLPAGTNAAEPYGVATNGTTLATNGTTLATNGTTLVVSDANNARAFVCTLTGTVAPFATLQYTLNLGSGAVRDALAPAPGNAKRVPIKHQAKRRRHRAAPHRALRRRKAKRRAQARARRRA